MNWLAQSWSVGGTPEKPMIDVHLRPGVKFQNGDPLTAEDVKFSYERLRDPKQSRWSHLQAAVESFEIVDPLHFRIHFSQPDATYVTDYLQIWVMPRAYFEKVGADGFARAPIGTGPVEDALLEDQGGDAAASLGRLLEPGAASGRA